MSSIYSPWNRLEAGVDTQWRTNLFDMLWKQRVDESPFCDVTITVQGKELKAHWCVLVACPYFESLYNSGMMEMCSGKVDLSFSDADTVEFALHFIYTGKHQFTQPETNAEAALKLADYLQLESLKADCGNQLLKTEVTAENCLHLCTIASLYNQEKLYKQASKVLYAVFPKVALQDEILEVPFDTLLSFVEDELLSYYSPIEFFDLTVRWVKHDLDTRSKNFDQLFAALKLNMIKTGDMPRVKEEKLVVDSNTCSDLVDSYEIKVKKGQITPDNCMKDVIVFGGIRKSAKQYGYLVSEKRWVRLPFFEQKHITQTKMVYASAVIDNELYMVRQVDSYKASARLFKLNKAKGCWEKSGVGDKDDVFYSIPICRHKLALSCGAYICLISCEKTHRWSTSQEAFIRLIPTQPGLQYKSVKIQHFRDNEELEHIAACSVQDHSIFIVGNKIKKLARGSSLVTVCVCYHIPTGTFTNCSKGAAKFGPLVYSDDSGKVHVVSIGAKRSKVFHPDTAKWSTRRTSLMPPKDLIIRPVSMTTVYKKKIYAFSVKEIGESHFHKKPRRPHMYTINNQSWEEFSPSPMDFSEQALPMVMTLPASLVTCPAECPHCIAKEPYVSSSDVDTVSPFDDKTASEEAEEEEDEEDEMFDRDSDSMYGYEYDSDSDHYREPGDCVVQ